MPAAFGYTNYSRRGFRNNLVAFGDIPALGESGPAGSILGGTGIAVSSRSAHRQEAIAFAHWLASRDVQRGIYVKANGQPAHTAAWNDPAADRLCGGFFSGVRTSMDLSWLRPRYAGFLPFVDETGDLINDFLRGLGTAEATLDGFEASYARSLVGAKTKSFDRMSAVIDLNGRIVIVTGGSRGLGLAQAKAVRAAGGVAVITASKAEMLAAGLSELNAGNGPRAFSRLHDVRDHDAAEAMLDDIERDIGPISALVNNAGVHLKKPIWDVDLTEWKNIVDINLTGVFSITKAALRYMLPRGAGSIVNISSMAGLLGLPSAAGYVATKTGLIGLTRSIAVDAGPKGIRCNAIAPGFIDTEMTRTVLAGDPARAAKIRGRIPIPRLADASEIADACLFLCSDMSSYVNGQVLSVDGGYSVGF